MREKGKKGGKRKRGNSDGEKEGKKDGEIKIEREMGDIHYYPYYMNTISQPTSRSDSHTYH